MKQYKKLIYLFLSVLSFSLLVACSTDNIDLTFPEESQEEQNTDSDLTEDTEKNEDEENKAGEDETVDYMNIHNFNGKLLKGINKKMGVKYDVDKYSKHYDVCLTRIREYENKSIYLNYANNSIDIDWSEYFTVEGNVNFTSKGYISDLTYTWHGAGGGNTYSYGIDATHKFEFTYKSDRLIEIKFSSNKYTYYSNGNTYLENIDRITSLQWENDNLVKIIKDQRYTQDSSDDSRDSERQSLITYDIEYDETQVNASSQFPLLISEYMMNDDLVDLCPTLGIMGKGPKNLSNKITVKEDGKEPEIKYEKIYLQTLNDTTIFHKENYDYTVFEYVYE